MWPEAKKKKFARVNLRSLISYLFDFYEYICMRLPACRFNFSVFIEIYVSSFKRRINIDLSIEYYIINNIFNFSEINNLILRPGK